MAVVTLRIGELAARAGVSTRSLRYYEQQRLLPAERERIDAQIAELAKARIQLTEVIAQIDQPMNDCN